MPHMAKTNHKKGRVKGTDILWGWHAVHEAIHNMHRRVERVVSCANRSYTIPSHIVHQRVDPKEMDRLLPKTAVHQGIMAIVHPLAGMTIDCLLPEKGTVLVLDHMTDPHNVGALWRSAAAFNVQAVVMTADHSPAVSGALAKAACGAVDHVPCVHVTNLARALNLLKNKGFFVVGLSEHATESLARVSVHPAAVVIGSEEKGLRPLVAKTCDVLTKIDTADTFQTLNASVAGAVALHHFFSIDSIAK